MRLSPKEAADHLGVSVQLVYQWCHERRLTHFRFGGQGKRGRISIEESDLLAFWASLRVEADSIRPEFKFTHSRLPS